MQNVPNYVFINIWNSWNFFNMWLGAASVSLLECWGDAEGSRAGCVWEGFLQQLRGSDSAPAHRDAEHLSLRHLMAHDHLPHSWNFGFGILPDKKDPASKEEECCFYLLFFLIITTGFSEMALSFGRRCLLLLCLTAIHSGHAAVQVRPIYFYCLTIALG